MFINFLIDLTSEFPTGRGMKLKFVLFYAEKVRTYWQRFEIPPAFFYLAQLKNGQIPILSHFLVEIDHIS